MNLKERKMVDLLQELRDSHAVTGVKMEFEAEGTRMQEAMRLKEISMAAGLQLTTKIGGCEAIKDMLDAQSIGSDQIVAPMVETPYALYKYGQAVRKVFGPIQPEFFFNVETETAVNNFHKMLDTWTPHGVVIGRIDLLGSLGLDRGLVNSDRILSHCYHVARRAKDSKMKVVVGGGVSYETLDFIKGLGSSLVDKFETRKVVFSCPGALKNTKRSFLKAVEFEMLWLENKKDYYGRIHTEDDLRLSMLSQRYKDISI